MISILFASLIGLSTVAAANPAATDSVQDRADPPPNVVEVWGPRAAEAVRSQRAGQSVMIRPEDETRFDSRVHLRSEANLTLPETGRTNASGFTLPRVRGQDSRFTEVYLDGLRIQDPYVGFPFIDDLDLRACGEMSIYVGNPPPSIPTVNPNGAISYRMFTPSSRRQQAGVSVGRPYGTAVWALGRHNSDDGSAIRLYAREHWTTGRYSYYDDNSTPYNKADDFYSERTHADRRARQFLPTFSWEHDGHRIAGLGLWNDAHTSLPARLSSLQSLATESSRHRVGRLLYSYQPNKAPAVVPSSLGVEVGRYDDNTDVLDPSNSVLGLVKSSSQRLQSTSGAINSKWQFTADEHPSMFYLRGETSDTRIDASNSATDGLTVRRRQVLMYSGLDLALSSSLSAELKTMITVQNDRLSGQKNLDSLLLSNQAKRTVIQGSSAGLAWQIDRLMLYGQLAKIKRPPTLLESFGDGALIRDNLRLVPEVTVHRELGLQWRNSELSELVSPLSQISLRTAVFRDDTRDRIILLPSVAQTMRAQNTISSQINGIEIAGDATAGATTIAAGYANMLPIDYSVPNRARIIPGVATHVATASISQIISVMTLRWATRYQSQIWRDSENTIAVPSYTVHDATVDAKWSFVSVGFGVFNVTNQRRLAIEAAKTKANTGYTSYSDYAGMPLPGRQWRLSLSAAW